MTTTVTHKSRKRRQLIGVGVGAIVLGDGGSVFLAQRGPLARNEQGLWAWPGGAIEGGETLEAAIRREYREEFGMEIEVLRQLAAFDHLLPGGEQWVSIAFLARHVSGEPRMKEPEKCSDCGWFAPHALPTPLSELAQSQWRAAARCLVSQGCWPESDAAAPNHFDPCDGKDYLPRQQPQAAGGTLHQGSGEQCAQRNSSRGQV